MGFKKKEKDFDEKEKLEEKGPFKGNKLIAKRDFRIVQNDVDIEIKEGEQVNVPERFLPNLITEGVIDPD